MSCVVTAGDDIGMVLSPQCFHNLNLHEDIFNHSNIHFWEYMQPGYDALGFISCTGRAIPSWPLRFVYWNCPAKLQLSCWLVSLEAVPL